MRRPPYDTGPHWGEVGIHGVHRLREWDAVATVEAKGLDGDVATVVVLPGGAHVLEEGAPGPHLDVALRVLRVEPPYRARLLRRSGDLWAVAARAIEVTQLLPDPGGGEIEVEWDGHERTVRVDGAPRLVPLPELGPVRRGRVSPYVAVLRRLHGDTWETEIAEL